MNNAKKCKYVVILRKRVPSKPADKLLLMDKLFEERVTVFKYLGAWVTETLTWSHQEMEMTRKVTEQVGHYTGDLLSL